MVPPPAIGSDGTIYVGSEDNNLYAIEGSSGGLADSPWPMFRHDLRHTGNVANDTNVWLGFTFDWNESSNWSCGYVPTSVEDVLIPVSPTGGHWPEITLPDAAIKNLTIEGGSLTIRSEGLLLGGPLCDTTPPTIISTFPANGATGVSRELDLISITFSEEMDGSWDYITNGDIWPSGDLYWSEDGKTFYIPRANSGDLLPANTTISFRLSPNSGFKDLAGNALEEYTLSFTTGD